MRALPAFAACLLFAACAATPVFEEDGWGVQRRFDGRTPALLSISEINAGTTPALGTIVTSPVRTRESGRYRVVLAAEQGIAQTWTPGAVLYDADLDRALAWMAKLGADEPRGVELRLTLVPPQGARRHQQLHPAGDTLVIDLLLPVPAQPRSRSAIVEGALATGLHEASHALRSVQDTNRSEDEYRSALVAACFRIEGAQRDDSIDLAAPGANAPREFTRAHSHQAALAVKRDLAAALGNGRLEGRNRAGIQELVGFCDRRLGPPVR